MSLIETRGAASSRGTGEFLGARTNPPWPGGSMWAACASGGARFVGLGSTSTNVLTQVGTDTDWKYIAYSPNTSSFTLAIKNNGTLWATGDNGLGQLGLGDTTDRTTFTQVGTDTNWAYVSTGESFTLAIKTNGTLWAWGRNSEGQLGLGDTTLRTSPVQVGTGTNWKTVAGAGQTSLAIKTDGTLWTCGNNFFGQLGQGIVPSTTPYTTFAQVGSSTNWDKVFGSLFTAFAITTTGEVYGCGQNATKMIENSSTAKIYSFIDLSVPYPCKWVAADISTTASFLAVVTTDGAVYGKGNGLPYMPGGVPGWYPSTVYVWTNTTIRNVKDFTFGSTSTGRHNNDGSVQFAGFPSDSMGIGVTSGPTPLATIQTMGNGRYWQNGVYNGSRGIWISLFP